MNILHDIIYIIDIDIFYGCYDVKGVSKNF